MYVPTMQLASFDHLSLNRRMICLRAFMEALCITNLQWLTENPGTPKFYHVRPRYLLKTHPKVNQPSSGSVITFNMDSWQDIPQTIQLGTGDCKDFACWRVAEMRMLGVPDVAPYIKVSQIKNLTLYHIVVRIGLQEEDPSEAMGMPDNVTYDDIMNGVYEHG